MFSRPQDPLYDEVVFPSADCQHFICCVANQLRCDANQHIGLHEPLVFVGQLLLDLSMPREGAVVPETALSVVSNVSSATRRWLVEATRL